MRHLQKEREKRRPYFLYSIRCRLRQCVYNLLPLEGSYSFSRQKAQIHSVQYRLKTLQSLLSSSHRQTCCAPPCFLIPPWPQLGRLKSTRLFRLPVHRLSTHTEDLRFLRNPFLLPEYRL